jgi:sodium transport system permease protein
VAARLYTSERLVVPARFRVPASAAPSRSTGAGDAMTLFALAFVLLYFVFVPLQKRHLAAGLWASEWIGLLGLVLLYARMSGQRFGQAVGLVRPRGRAVAGAVLIGCSAWAAVAVLSEWLVPVPQHVLDLLRKSVLSIDGRHGFLMTLVLVAAGPAVCEEALFRGPILRGLGSRLSPAAAILTTAALFGLFHLDIYRVIPATLLGTLLGYLAYQTRSVVPAMLAHFCNNAILVTLARAGLDARMEALSHRALTLIVLASVGLSAAGVVLVRGAASKPEL